MRITETSKNHLKARQDLTTIPDTFSTIIPTTPPLPSSSTIGPPQTYQNSGHETTIIAITAASLAIIVCFIFAFYILRHCHEKKRSSEKQSKSFFKLLWSKSSSESKNYQIPSANEQLEPIARNNERDTSDLNSLEMARRVDRADRAASFRSVITLPSYIQNARQNEQVLGREGERGGIDVVVEFPDTAEEEERRREDEMEALYQVRLARRRENEARERRRARREARERGDSIISIDTGEDGISRDDDTPGQTVEELRAEHGRIKRQRQRAVSIVSYAEIGVARHDGTRLNSVSHEIEQTDLLDDAASISRSNQNLTNPRSGSIRSFFTTNSDINPTISPWPSTSGNINPNSQHTQPNLELSSIPDQTSGANSPSPLILPRVWDSPRARARQFSNGERTTSLNHSISSVIEQSPIPSSIPPEYRTVPLESPMSTTEFPPGYSFPEIAEDNTQNQIFEEITPTTSNINENSSSSSSPIREPDGIIESDNHSKSCSPSSRLHNRRSSRSKLPPLSNLRLRPLPSIEINPASPPTERGTEIRIE
ncbi:hypothetical protein GcM1_224037 [Golovinomyces cichoracearum]|uniref:Uncharacterized protein n=1 Tax=Golovinomyces cichoracearum TaxID=62708 RepID=A0A420IQI2_9PEZI|nr:hypothetical protein GcM1_224037 [Golovinomyces cichoracearum]